MRILLVSPRPLRPARRGHQLRALQVATALATAGHGVTVLTPSGGTAADPTAPFRETTVADPPARRAARAFSAWVEGLPAQAGYGAGPALAAACLRLASEADLVIVQLSRLASIAQRLTERGTPWVADLVDSLALNLERRAALDRPWLRPLIRLEARRLLAVERRLIASARDAWLVSERDRKWLAERVGDGGRKLSLVPLAVEPRLATARAERQRPAVACLTGNLGYFPTHEGARWLLREVWPRVRARRLPVELCVAGARPSRGLARLVRQAGGRLLADPPSLDAVLASASLALVPMRAGSGIPIKLLEAWATGVPVIATPWAAAGADGVADEDHLAAGDRDAWVTAIDRLAGDAELGARLAAAGRRRLVDRFSVERLRAALERSLGRT